MHSQTRKNPSIQLSGLLGARAPNKVFLAIVLGMLAGLAYTLIIPLVLLSIQPAVPRLFQIEDNVTYLPWGLIEVSTPKLALMFALTCFCILVCRSISRILLTRVATDVMINLRREFRQRISQLPIRDIERIGSPRLLAALTTDIPMVVGGASVFPDILVNIATLVGLLGFLVYLNIEVFLFIVGAIIFGALTYRIPLYLGERHLARARHHFDSVQEGMDGLIYGAKELKLNPKKRHAFLTEDIDSVEAELAACQKRGDSLIIFGITYGDLISFFVIGAVTYSMANYYSLSQEYLIGIVMVLLYITGPIAILLNSMAPVMQASVAAKKLKKLLNDMPIETSSDQYPPEVLDCQEIRLTNVQFNHATDKMEETTFQVGPTNLSVKRGDITFLVGGNGSGKTTLGKLLSLHYIPLKGDIYFDNHKVCDNNRDSYRLSISAIYSDFHLFRKLFAVSNENLDQAAARYIKDLGLDGKVTIADGHFSSVSLSDGQKKRLALLVAYLEDRSIYIFDEWAADQDPTFKKIFYEKILPSLKEMNKLVVVITHDDRYFHLADKLVRMDNGQIVSESNLKKGVISKSGV